MPERFPKMDFTLGELAAFDYRETAFRVLRLFLTDFTDAEIRAAVDSAYDGKFATDSRGLRRELSSDVAPLTSAAGLRFLELYHGPTLAFKDMALSILPRLMRLAAAKRGVSKRVMILTATSGDTGKAALAGFAGAEGVDIAVFYPSEGVSPAQKLQMTTQEGGNVAVAGIIGNFDDAQTGVKALFTDPDFVAEMSGRGYAFSSANSINIGRLVPQVAYYFHAYAEMCRAGALSPGERLGFTVPTGNFGNILAAYYAGRIGLPIGKLVCASNSNKVLFDYFKTGEYNTNRVFTPTASPSMDILVSSNFERYLYHKTGSAEAVRAAMGGLGAEGRYVLPDSGEVFFGEYATEPETFAAIRDVFGGGALIDPHTAVAVHACREYRAETGDDTPNVIVATASPFKFAASVLEAVTGAAPEVSGVSGAIEELSRVTGVPAPASLLELQGKRVLHPDVIEKDGMEAFVRAFASRRNY